MREKDKPGTGHLQECGDHKIVGPHLSLSSLQHNSQGRGSFVQCPRTEKRPGENRPQQVGEESLPSSPTLDPQDPGSLGRPAGSRGSAGLKGRTTPRRGSASIEHRGREISAPRRPSHPPPPDRSCFHRHLVSSAGWKRISQGLGFPGDTYA